MVFEDWQIWFALSCIMGVLMTTIDFAIEDYLGLNDYKRKFAENAVYEFTIFMVLWVAIIPLLILALTIWSIVYTIKWWRDNRR